MVSAQDRSALFDPWAKVYAAVVPWMWHYPCSDTERWMSHHLRGRQRILDVGTGPGHWLSVAARDEARQCLMGIDISDEFLAVARKRLAGTGATLHKADAACTEFGSGEFDAIICSGVIDTVPNPSEFVAEFARLLSGDGELLLVVRSGDDALSRLFERLFRSLAGLGHAWHIKSLKGLSVPAELWNRTAFLSRSDALLDSGSLVATEVERKRIWTVMSVTKVLASNAID